MVEGCCNRAPASTQRILIGAERATSPIYNSLGMFSKCFALLIELCFCREARRLVKLGHLVIGGRRLGIAFNRTIARGIQPHPLQYRCTRLLSRVWDTTLYWWGIESGRRSGRLAGYCRRSSGVRFISGRYGFFGRIDTRIPCGLHGTAENSAANKGGRGLAANVGKRLKERTAAHLAFCFAQF